MYAIRSYYEEVERKPGEGAVPTKGAGAGALKAPLPGNIFKINVAPGDVRNNFV